MKAWRMKRRKARNRADTPRERSLMSKKTARSIFHVVYLPEPRLEFAYGQELEYPRDGLFLFGPKDTENAFSTTRYGVIGTPDGIDRFRRWSKTLTNYIPIPPPSPRGRLIEPQHVPFPGFKEAFHSDWPQEPSTVISDISLSEIHEALYIDNRHEAIKKCVDLFVLRLAKEENRLEAPPAFWFVVIPEIIYELGRPESKVPRDEQIKGDVTISRRKAQSLKIQPTLFGSEDADIAIYDYATHFRRQLKARLLKDKIVTQIVRETTLTPEDFTKSDGRPLRRVEDPATIAWKLGTGAYYKGGGKPWQLANVRTGVCYVGLVYKRSDLTSDERHACCAAQMFLTDGEGVVFRGALGPWFHTDTKQFHLDATAAEDLTRMVVKEYSDRHDNKSPTELFIHATSSFTDDEWKGFVAGGGDATRIVGVQISDTRDDLKLFRTGAYPVIRGTALILGSNSAYLWTSGYVPRLDTYMGPETPNPLFVKVQRGECPLETVLSDILGLTKINFNSCLFNDRLPVTIRFANAVGDVLISAPIDSERRLPFKFYI